jgi:DNA (cytosine-5)-methyltransferase 1
VIGATLCSGIGAPECAMPWIDWRWHAEIEPFPAAVHAHRFPGSVNLGDMTAEDFVARAAAVALPDILVAGTPCQAFSVAGLRNSLADARGNLTLVFVRICNEIDDLRRARGLAPLWILWENVPGVLSTKDNAFGAFLGGMVGHDDALVPQRGKWSRAGVVSGPQRTAAWRELDAQHFGVAQRRRRIFVLARGNSGNWDCADALLPIIESVRWHPAPRRETGKGVAPTISARPTAGGGLGTDFDLDGGLIEQRWPAGIAPTLNAAFGEKQGLEDQHALGGAGLFVPTVMSSGQANASITEDATGAPTLRAIGHAGSHANGGGGQVAVAFALGSHAGAADGGQTNRSHASGGPVGSGISENVAYSLRAGRQQSIAHTAVRRLTPVECERLQGFPDGWTDIPWRGKPTSPDGPRYKALGNSMAVPVMRYIGQQILRADAQPVDPFE